MAYNTNLPTKSRLPGVQALTDLSDVDITNPVAGEGLFWNSPSSLWTDQSVTASGVITGGQNIGVTGVTGGAIVYTIDPFLVDNINELTPAAGVSINHAVKVTNGLIEVGLPTATQGNVVINNDGAVEPNILLRGTGGNANINGSANGYVEITPGIETPFISSTSADLNLESTTGSIYIDTYGAGVGSINLTALGRLNLYGAGSPGARLDTDNGPIVIQTASGNSSSTITLNSDKPSGTAITLDTTYGGGGGNVVVSTNNMIVNVASAFEAAGGNDCLLQNSVPVVSIINNLGFGEGLYVGRTGQSSDFKSIVAGSGIGITGSATEITISKSATSTEILLGPELLWNGNPIYVINGILTEYGFANSDANNIVAGIVLPFDYTSGENLTFTYYWHATPTTGNVKWDFVYGRQRPGVAVVTTGTSDTQTVAVSGTADALVTSSFTINGATLSGQAGDLLSIKISRNGTAGGDTLAAQCNLTYAKITYA